MFWPKSCRIAKEFTIDFGIATWISVASYLIRDKNWNATEISILFGNMLFIRNLVILGSNKKNNT